MYLCTPPVAGQLPIKEMHLKKYLSFIPCNQSSALYYPINRCVLSFSPPLDELGAVLKVQNKKVWPPADT